MIGGQIWRDEPSSADGPSGTSVLVDGWMDQGKGRTERCEARTLHSIGIVYSQLLDYNTALMCFLAATG